MSPTPALDRLCRLAGVGLAYEDAWGERREVPEATRDAQEYTWQALAHGFHPGMGQLLPDRFFWARDVGEQENDEAAA